MASFRAVHFVLFFLLIVASTAFSSSILLEEMLQSQLAAQHPRLRPPKPCPVDFENKNYTTLIGTCRKPYKAEPCCKALRNIACPHMEELNDRSNDCAMAMFSNIDYNGNYPTGLFFKLCNDRKKGMKCEES